MIAIVDYGVGNLFSLKSSLKMIGAEAVVTGDAAAIRACDKIILPGVGKLCGHVRAVLGVDGHLLVVALIEPHRAALV